MTIQLWRYISLAIKSKKKGASGFTLMELLMSIIVSSLVVSGLLYLVNELIRFDRREATLENVQRDTQRSMDYITDELREAVFVYPNPTTVTNQLTASNLPTGGDGAVPVLAFWKPVFLTSVESKDMDSVPCPELPSPFDDECQALKLRQSYYSLVVYFSLNNTQDNNNPNWAGQSRLIRYTLPQYKKSVIGTTGKQTDGYVAPNNDFLNWSPDEDVDTDGDWSVLVDYIGSPTTAPALVTTNCDEFGQGYQLSPDTADISNSFMACISTPGSVALGSNQEVVVFLRGDAKSADQAFVSPTSYGSASASQSTLPTLQSRVLVRGAANKNPNGD